MCCRDCEIKLSAWKPQISLPAVINKNNYPLLYCDFRWIHQFAFDRFLPPLKIALHFFLLKKVMDMFAYFEYESFLCSFRILSGRSSNMQHYMLVTPIVFHLCVTLVVVAVIINECMRSFPFNGCVFWWRVIFYLFVRSTNSCHFLICLAMFLYTAHFPGTNIAPEAWCNTTDSFSLD